MYELSFRICALNERSGPSWHYPCWIWPRIHQVSLSLSVCLAGTTSNTSNAPLPTAGRFFDVDDNSGREGEIRRDGMSPD